MQVKKLARLELEDCNAPYIIASIRQKKASGSYSSQVLAIFVLAMAAQKSKQPAVKPDNDSSGSESDNSESDDTGPNSHIVKKPESLQDEDEDGSSESESDDIRPSKTVTKVPQPSQTVAKAPGKASTLKRPRCDDEGGPTENARPRKRITKESETQLFHESYIESSGDCMILAGKTYFKVFRMRFLKV